MEWFEWVFTREFRQYLLAHDLVFPLLFLIRLLGVTAIELIRPARKVEYSRVIVYDFAVFLLYQFIIFPIAGYIDLWIAVRPNLPDVVLNLPLPLRVTAYFVIADFGHYWIHWLMHTAPVWRIHKWHHVPTYMYWLAGVRATIPQQVIVNLPYIFAYSFLDLSPWWMYLAIGMFNALQNDWMHMNVAWRFKWLEWLIVTPRYHHIHHSNRPEHYTANLAALFTVWDRLFGTYVDPDKVSEPLSFGIGEKVPLPRLALGV
ncbi:putative sterol desaturase [Nitrospira japonica]|uniref:Putative sterol desaturase n=1 Tax=Nitrospira japonica TaxID=1325564 RepID=A0A1W1I4L9_9BACT|nr:sterol desaturase family protein [Nitrospira japonica]SLM47954.1 putative sterol desaturase [Nitrospira japonica]